MIALDAGGKEPLPELVLPGDARVMLFIGGEDRSVGQFVLNLADHVVSIPQQGKINSLNASVAGAIAMFSLRGSGR